MRQAQRGEIDQRQQHAIRDCGAIGRTVRRADADPASSQTSESGLSAKERASSDHVRLLSLSSYGTLAAAPGHGSMGTVHAGLRAASIPYERTRAPCDGQENHEISRALLSLESRNFLGLIALKIRRTGGRDGLEITHASVQADAKRDYGIP